MEGLIELAALALGMTALFRLVFRRHTVRVRLVQRRLPPTPILVGVALVLITIAAIGT
jgi:hypothetical protein